MILYLVRHGEASSSNTDPQRPLTPMGRRHTEKVAGFLRRLGLRVRAIEHSGKLRAQETAEILGSVVESEEDVAKVEGLMPNDDVEPWAKELSSAGGDRILVGHLPFLSKLASRLLTGDETQTIVDFKRSSVLCLERTDEGRWRLRWLITPEIL